jgi:hypothetical protein
MHVRAFQCNGKGPAETHLDTDEEIAYFRAGGLLPMMCERVLQEA